MKKTNEIQNKIFGFFKHGDDGILVVNKKTKRIIFSNPKISKILGYSEKELLKMKIADIYAPKIKVSKTTKAKNNLTKNVEIFKKTKETIYCNISHYVMDLNEDKYIMMFFRDITEEKTTKERYYALVEQNPDCIKLYNKKEDLVYINKGGLKEHKIKNLKEAINSKWNHKKTLGKKTDIKNYKKAWQRAIEKGEKSILEFKHTKEGSKNEFCSELIVPIKNHEGEITNVFGISRDITNTKKAEEELKLYKLLYKTSSDAFMTLETPHWKFSSGNPSMIKMFGLKDEKELLSKKPWDLSPKYQPDGQLSSRKAAKMIKTAMEKGYHFFEWEHKKIDGKTFPATVLLTKLQYKGKDILQATVRDITKEKESEKIKNEFISIASHQLRTPLSGIKWFSELLLEETSNLNKQQIYFIKKIYEENQNLILLTKELLDISNIENEAIIKNKKTSISIEKLINKIIKETNFLIKQKDLKIKIPPKLCEKITLKSSKEDLEQILSNIISNSVKFSRNKGIVKINCKETSNKFIFSIKDNGAGIPNKEKEKVFKKFFRAKNIATKSTGTGLGLYITKALVNRQGGEIWFKSKENKGSTFYFSLPKK